MKLNKTALLTTIAGLSLASGVTYADTGFSTNASISAASMYLFRGYDLSMEDPVLQGDFGVSHDSGFWVSVWGSTYDFGAEDGVEVDFSAGYDHAISDDVSIGIGLTEYTYSGDSESTTEYYLSLSVNNFSITYYDDVDLDTVYISVDTEFDLANNLSLSLHAADYETSNDMSVGLSYSFNDHLSAFANYSYIDIDVVGDDNYFLIGASYSF